MKGVLQNVEFGCAEVVVGRQGRFNDRKIEQGVEGGISSIEVGKNIACV